MSTFRVPTLEDLDAMEKSISEIFNTLPVEIRQNIDTSGKAEKYASKRVKFQDLEKVAEPAVTVTPAVQNEVSATEEPKQVLSGDQVRERVKAKLEEMKLKRGQGKPRQDPKKKKGKKNTTAPVNKKAKVDANPKDQKPKEEKQQKQEPKQEQKIITSKVDFEERDFTKKEKASKKQDKKHLLEKALKQKETAIKPNDIQTAILKAKGEKVFDDVKKLKSAIKRNEQKKKRSAKEWSKTDKKKKRAENIAKRKEQVKKGKKGKK
mgnify:CR=1 FL=1